MKKHLLKSLLAVALLLVCGNVWGENWVKVSSAPEDWSGEYLLVNESSATEGVAWTGADVAGCSVNVTISNGVISTKPETAVSLTIATMEGGYSIMVNGGTNNGSYIAGKSKSNTIVFAATAGLNTIEIADGGANIVSNSTFMRFNSSSDQKRFRYYQSGQKSVQLYKKTEGVVPVVTYYTLTQAVSPEKAGNVTLDRSSMLEGEKAVATAEAYAGYTFSSWTIEGTGATLSSTTANPTTVTMGTADATITANFEAKVLASIALEDVQTDYYVGDEFKFNGKVLATYADGTSDYVKGATTSEVDMSTEGEKEVTVSYSWEGVTKTATYTINVTKEADNIAWDLSIDNTSTVNETEISWTSDVAAMSDVKNNSTTPTNNYYGGDKDNRTSTRFYKGSKLTISPVEGYAIISVVFEATTSSYATNLMNSTWTNASANVAGSTVTVTPADGTLNMVATIGGTCGFSSVKVYYTTAVVKVVANIEVSDMKTTFEQNDDFEFGGTVTAYFEDGSNADVTSSASFSGYDMSTAGVQTVTVTYKEKTANYAITVKEAGVYANLAELVAAGEPTTAGKTVTVTLTDEEILSVYVTSSGYRNGIYLQAGDKEIEVFCYDVPEDWMAGGTVSGTLTCLWKKYNSTWELCPTNWDDLEYTAPEPVTFTVTLNSNGFATYANANPTNIVSGAKAYTATECVNGVVSFEEVEGAMCGNRGFLLQGEPNATVTIEYVATADVVNSILWGFTVDTAVSALDAENYDWYGLKGNQFLKLDGGTVKAGKAALRVKKGTEANALSFRFGGTTMVEQMLKENKDVEIYDLLGRKVENATKGIYIIGGKKVMVK